MTSTSTTAESTTTDADATNATEEVKAKSAGKGKGKTPRLKLVKGFRPGVHVAAKGAAIFDVYSIVFGIPLTSAIGISDEIAQVHQFAADLDAMAQVEKVGVVDRIGIADGTAEVMLKLSLPDEFPAEPADEIKDDLAAVAFTKVNPLLVDAAVLKSGNARHRATWTFKVNGSPLDDGMF